MTRPSSPPTDSPAAGLNALQAWRRDAALRLGAQDAVAHRFGETGLIALDDQPLSLQPLSSSPSGPWLASTRAARPAGISEARWCDALLLAGSQSLLSTHAAFGLAPDGDAVLMLRTTTGLGDPELLGAEVAGLLALRSAVVEGLKTRLPQELMQSQPDTAGPAEETDKHQATDADAQHFEAPGAVLAMLHNTMLQLGRTAAEALAATRSGSLEIDGLAIGLACDIDGENLVVAVDLGPDVLGTETRRRAAVRANTELMAFAGMAVVRERGQARLMTRCPLPGLKADRFASWLQKVAGLATAIVRRNSADTTH